MAKVLFVLSLCVLSFGYGAFAMQYQLFPYQILRQAHSAAKAWYEVLQDNGSFEFVDDNGEPEPQVTKYETGPDDSDYILMIGQPGALMSHCPDFGCMAWITNRDGVVVHTWEVDFGTLWADTPHAGLKEHSRIAPFGMHMSDRGELIANFQSAALFPYGIGIAKFDKDGNVIWARANYSHHGFSVAPDGRIYTPAHRLRESPFPLGSYTKLALHCEEGKIYSDVVLVLTPDGETIEEIPMLDLLVAQDYVGLLEYPAKDCDPIHLNYVEYVSQDMAQLADGLEVGDLIVSLRYPNMIAAIDVETKTVKWAVAGRTVAQHSPRFLPDGSIIVLDNQGGKSDSGGSRLVRLHYGRQDQETVFPGPGHVDLDFSTATAGFIDPHPDGVRLLVSLTRQGRVLEIDLRQGRVLWELVNTHRLEADDGKVVRQAAIGAHYVGQPSFLDTR